MFARACVCVRVWKDGGWGGSARTTLEGDEKSCDHTAVLIYIGERRGVPKPMSLAMLVRAQGRKGEWDRPRLRTLLTGKTSREEFSSKQPWEHSLGNGQERIRVGLQRLPSRNFFCEPR